MCTSFRDVVPEYHTLQFLQHYPLSPFKVVQKKIILPQKYLEILESLTDLPETGIDATEDNWTKIRELLITGYWIDCWYTVECGDALPTPKSVFIPLTSTERYEWQMGKFLRLTSLSSKEQTEPIYLLNEQIKARILNTERCQSSLQLAQRTGREIQFVVRDWIDMKDGSEWRCFVFEDKLKAISLNDFSDPELSHQEIKHRAQLLLNKVKFNLPCVDCVMDIWLHSSDSDRDLVIEFNSYGFWGNAGLSLFDWIEDGMILYNPEDIEIEIRNNGFS